MSLIDIIYLSPLILVGFFALGAYIWLMRELKRNKGSLPHHPAVKARP